MEEDEIKIILAFLFKRAGKKALPPSDLYLSLSMNLKWFNPTDAKELIDFAKIRGFLLYDKTKDLLKTNFEYEKIHVPAGFHPSEKTFRKTEEKKVTGEEKILKKIIKHLSIKTNESEQTTAKKVIEIAKEKGIVPEVAGLFLGMTYNIDMSAFFDTTASRVFEENKK